MENWVLGFFGAGLFAALLYLAKFFSKIGVEADLLMTPDAAALIEHCKKVRKKTSVKILGYFATLLIALGSLLIASFIFTDEPGISRGSLIGAIVYFIGVALLARPYNQAANEHFRELYGGSG